MSAVNVWIEPERVLVGTDTLSTMLNGSSNYQVSKCTVLPLARTVVAGRGVTLGLQVLAYVLHQQPNIVDFDSAVEAMPPALQQAFQLITAQAATLYPQDPDLLQEQEITMAGWSDKAGRMKAIRWYQDRSGGGFERMDIAEPGFISPWEGPEPEYFQGDADGMRHALREQVLQARAKHGRDAHGRDIALGGSLVLVEITRASLTVTTHELPPLTRLLSEMVISPRR